MEPDWWVITNLWIQVAIAVGTVGAVLVALFGDRAKRWVWPPKLDLKLDSATGSLTTAILTDPKTETSRSEKARYFHLRVSNRGSVVSNAAAYVTHIQLNGAGGWYSEWTGEVPLLWSFASLHPLLRPVGVTPIYADLFELIKDKWLSLTVVIRPNSLPGEDFPGRWRKAIEMVITVKVLATEGQSAPKMFFVKWDGGWSDGDAEIGRHFNIRPDLTPLEGM